MIPSLRILFSVGIAALVTATTGSAQQLTPATTRGTDTFQVAFGMSYYSFDECDDRPLGELYRRALLDRFGHCPFPDEAKRRFASWATAESKREDALLDHFVADHGKLPDRLDGMKETCREHRNSMGYRKVREVLNRYARGEANADDVIFSCDTPTGAP
jgi:hypothetical protein